MQQLFRLHAALALLAVLIGLNGAVSGVTIPSDTTVPKLKEVKDVFEGGVQAECKEFYASYLEIFSMYTEDLKGEFVLQNGNVLVFKGLVGKFYGGTLQGTVKVTLGTQVSYRVDLEFADVNFRWFAMNVFDAGTSFRGVLNCTLSMSGNEDGDVTGTMGLRLKNGYFETLPRWFTLFTLVNIIPIKENVISEGRVDIIIENGRFLIAENGCELHTEDVIVFGRGSIDFNGNADIVLNPVGKHKFTSVLLPPIAVLWKWVDKGLWRIPIKGPLFTGSDFRISPWFKL